MLQQPHRETAVLRLLTEADIPAAMNLSTIAGWNQTAQDWQRLLALEPEGCFGIEASDVLAATATLLTYSRKLGWIGMVLTHPHYRRRGFARRLFTAALDRAQSLGIETIKLDAAEEGQPLYESFGFRPEQEAQRWWRAGSATADGKREGPGLPSSSIAADAQVFGVDRSRVLEALAASSDVFVDSGGYLLARPGSVCHYLGPCVAPHRAGAQRLIQTCLSGVVAAGWFWDLLTKNLEALDLARQLGFERRRTLLRMVRGPQITTSSSAIFAIAGFELG